MHLNESNEFLSVSRSQPEATHAAGEAPADPQHLGGDGMAHPHSRGFGSGSVFYTSPPAVGARDSAGQGPPQQLLTAPATAKTASKKSPKLWPKRNTLVAPINGPSPPEDFRQLHEEYGKEVRELMADWLRRKQEEVSGQGDLIDLS